MGRPGQPPDSGAHGSAAPRRRADESDRSERLRTRLREEIGGHRYERYFADPTRIRAADSGVRVTVPSPFMAEVIRRRFDDVLRRAAAGEDNRPVEVEVRTDRSLRAASQSPPAAAGMPSPARDSRPAARAPRQVRHQLADFIVGKSNRLAYAAARRIADGEDDAAFSPLFIHGASGLGKTHLLQGIAAGFAARCGSRSVRYVSAEAFTNEYIASVRNGKIDQFRRAWRRVRLLCIDDVHFVAGKEGTQQELLYTLETLGLEEARVVLASDEHPRDIARLADRLSSRFLAGAIVRIDPPDEPLRRDLVRGLASRRGLHLGDDAIGLVVHRAARGAGSVREIEGMLTQVEAVRRLAPDMCGHREVLDAASVSRAFGLTDGGDSASRQRSPRGPIRFGTIAEETCESLSVSRCDVTGNGRHKRVVLARRIMIRLARELTTLSFPEIARHLRRPSHSTVVTAHRTVCDQLERGEAVRESGDLDGVPLAEVLATVRARVLERSGR